MKKCSTIIFSRNRPLQLTLCLQTLLNHCTDILQQSEITVLYRNDEEYRKSFDNLMSEFPQISFKKEENFKKDLLSLLPHKSNISFAFFIVDDQIFTNDFSMYNVISTLVENDDCLGFSLRLGLNTKMCFPYNCEQKVPNVINATLEILKYDWKISEYDFGYPLELSSSCYRLDDVIDILENCIYESPNTLESRMAECHIGNKPNLLMFGKSVAFSAPLNLVQGTHPNRNASFNPDTFRLMYERGLRFDSKQFDGYVSSGAHEIPEKIEVININEN